MDELNNNNVVEVQDDDEVVENNENQENVETKSSKAKSIIGKVFAGIGAAILTFLIVVVGWLGIQKFILHEPVPSFAGYSHLIVTTGSMESEISAGDLIIIKDTGNYKNGDIITFLHEGETTPTTHRIIGINDDGTYVTKGDANNTADIVDVKKELIVGEVTIDENGQPLSVIRNVGIFVEWVKSGGGLIYIIAFIVILGGGIYLVVKKED